MTDGTSKVNITTIDKRRQDSLILKPRGQTDTVVKDPQKVLNIMTNLIRWEDTITLMDESIIIINMGAIILGVGAPPMPGGNIIFVTPGEQAVLQQENLAVEVEAALLSILQEVEVLAEAEI